ncbi:MAG: hypothetical protein R2752_04395 [Vicinamibacterales bacterium]
MCGVVWLLSVPASRLTPARVLGLMLAVGCLPWLHRKYSPLEIGLALLVFAHLRPWIATRGRGLVLALIAAAVVPQLALHAFTFLAWGSPAGPQLQTDFPFTVSGTLRGGLGLVLDRERGLLAYAPVYLLVPAAVALTWRASRWLVAVAALLYLPMAAFNVWGAGFSPAARYLVPPGATRRDPRRDRSIAGRCACALVLVVFQAAIVAVVWNDPRLLWPEELGQNLALQHVPVVGPLWARLLPSLWTGDGGIVTAVPAALVVVMTALWWAARGRVPRAA